MFQIRVITALVLLVPFAYAFFIAPTSIPFTILIHFTVIAAQYEWFRLLNIQRFTSLSIVIACSLLAEFFYEMQSEYWLQNAIVVANIIWAVAIVSMLAFRDKCKQLRTIQILLAIVLPWTTWLATRVLFEISARDLFGVLLIIWFSDIAAYAFGKKFGKHKLAPIISPGKTWEGVLGAFLASVFISIIYPFDIKHGVILPHARDWFEVMLLAACISAIGVLGDLFESALKRNADVKDSGNLLPGHGGVLDRIDALMPTLPFACWLLYTRSM